MHSLGDSAVLATIALLLLLAAVSQLVDAGTTQCIPKDTVSGSSKKRQAPMAASNFTQLAGVWRGDLEYVDLPGCLDTVVFNVSVVVLDHLWLQFKPINGSSNCPTYIFDSQTLYDEEAGHDVSVGILQPAPDVFENPELLDAFTTGWPMGLISADFLLQAIDTFDGEFGDAYDIITSNCAAKIINVLYFLYLPVEDRTFLAWLGRKLETDYVMSLLYDSPNITLLYPNETVEAIKAKPNSELISRLVDYSLTKEIAAYNETLQMYKTIENAPRAAPRVPASAPFVRSSPSASPVAAPRSTVGAPQANGKVSSATSVVVVGYMAFVATTLVSLML